MNTVVFNTSVNITPLPEVSNQQSTQTTQGNNQIKKNKKIPFLIIGIVIIIISLPIAGYFFIIRPRVMIVGHFKKMALHTSTVRGGLQDISQSFKTLYGYISETDGGQSENATYLLRLDTSQFVSDLKKIDSSNVAGVSTKTVLITQNYDDFIEDIGVFTDRTRGLRKFGSLNKKVLGQTTVEPEVINKLRQLKEISDTASKQTEATNRDLSQLSTYVYNAYKEDDPELKTPAANLNTIDQQTQLYLDQAGKTSNYYYRIADLQVELIPFLVSYVNLITNLAQTKDPDIYSGQLNELEQTLVKLSKKVKDIDVKSLPTGVEELHQDNLKIFDILQTNLTQVKASITTGDFESFIKSVLTLEQTLDPLQKRAKTLEISFWQNNSVLKQGPTIINSYQQAEQTLNSDIVKRKVPFLN